MSVIMWLATVTIAVLRVINTQALGNFDPADVVAGADPFGSDFAELHGIATRIRVERSIVAFLSFCVWLRVFKYTKSVPVFGTIGRTMMRAFPAVRPVLVNLTASRRDASL
jgi:Polycystin cation channel